jgi:4-hydroxybenzoate polyprenyltransferase
MDILKRFRIPEILLFSTVSLLFLKYNFHVHQFILFMFTIFSYNYFMFSFNDFMDKDKDYRDLTKRNRNPFLDKKYEKPAIIFMVLSGLFLVLAGLFNLRNLYLNVLLFLIAFTYNAGIRAKNKPFLDVIIHGAWIGGMIVYGIVFFGVTITIKEIALLFQYLVISTLVEISQGMRDYEVDKETKETTTVVYIGIKNSKIAYAALILVFSLITPLLVESIYLKYLSLLIIPIFFISQQKTYEQRGNILNLLTLLSVFVFFM